MDLKIQKKRALVLGGSSGLGKSIAKSLVQEHVEVAIGSRDENKLKKTADEIGASMTLLCDLYQANAGRKSVQLATEKLGGVDILVCNTGGPPKGAFSELSTAQWESEFQNLWLSTVEAIQEVLPQMKSRRWGRILLVTSVAAKEPMPLLTISNGLRAGLLGMVKSLSQEVAVDGITVNALLPGYTRTERLQELGINESQIANQIPAKRLGDPSEFAALTTFLASDLAGYITGQAIACDGGYLKGI